MDTERIAADTRSVSAARSRRGALRGLASTLGLGILMPAMAEAKKRKKKCKKPAPCEDCPQQTCCTCLGAQGERISCEFIEGDNQDCFDLCVSRGANGSQSSDLNPNRANYCAADPEFACVSIPCPVV